MLTIKTWERFIHIHQLQCTPLIDLYVNPHNWVLYVLTGLPVVSGLLNSTPAPTLISTQFVAEIWMGTHASSEASILMTSWIETQASHIDMLACCADVSVGRSPTPTAADLQIQACMHSRTSGQLYWQGRYGQSSDYSSLILESYRLGLSKIVAQEAFFCDSTTSTGRTHSPLAPKLM